MSQKVIILILCIRGLTFILLLSRSPLYYVLQEAFVRDGNCQDWVAKYFEIYSWIHFFKVLLQLSRDISNLRLNHNLDCRFWGYKIQSWTWSGTKLRCSWLFVFYCRNISFVWIKRYREGLGKGMLPVVIKFPECKPLKCNLYPLYFCYQ